MKPTPLLAALLAIAASGCSKPPVATAGSHPPAEDLQCLAEPAAMTDAEVIADIDGRADEAWNAMALIAGRSCRDTLARACLWHKLRGMRDAPC